MVFLQHERGINRATHWKTNFTCRKDKTLSTCGPDNEQQNSKQQEKQTNMGGLLQYNMSIQENVVQGGMFPVQVRRSNRGPRHDTHQCDPKTHARGPLIDKSPQYVPLELYIFPPLRETHQSQIQNPVLKWSTQNHVKNLEGGRSYFWLGSSLTNLHLPGF